MLRFIQFFTIPRQIALFVISLLATVAFHVAWGWGGFAGSWLFLIIMIILAVKQVIIGTVNAAAMKLQAGDIEGAENILKYTWKPEWLRFGYHGTYYILLSQIAFQKKDFKKSEANAHKALKLDLADDFAAMMYLQLMAIYGQRRNQAKVKEYLKKAKKLKVSNPMIKENIAEVEAAMSGKITAQQRKMMGRQKTAMNQGYMRRSRRKR